MGSTALEQTLGWISELKSWDPQSLRLLVVEDLREDVQVGGR